VTVGPEDSFDGVWLRLAASEPATCRIDASGAAAETGVCRPAIPARSPALVQNGSLAYLALRRPETTPPRFELGATGHGPNGPQLARRICTQIQAWGHDPGARPSITLHAAEAGPRPGLPGRAVKGWTHLTTSF
jgi:protein-L-isoaspartate(D-aspartate) O-methyltransferase